MIIAAFSLEMSEAVTIFVSGYHGYGWQLDTGTLAYLVISVTSCLIFSGIVDAFSH